MGFICTFIGSFFLLNPNLRMIDYLPDIVGCILIIIGLSKIYVLDGRLEDARKHIFYLTALSAIKLPLSFYIIVKAKNFLLPVSFIVSVVEVITMVGFFVNLFGGLQYLTSRDSKKRKHIKRSESASIVCFIFAIARGVLGFAPELLSLGEQRDNFDYSYRPTPEQNAALIKPYAELLCFVVILIFGIYVAILLGKYLIGLHKDKSFTTNLRDRYKQYELDNIQTFTLRRTRNAFFLLFLGILFLFNQILDSVNIIPNCIAFVFIALGWLYLDRYAEEKSYKPLLLFVPLVPLSLYNNFIQYKLLSGTDIRIIGTDLSVQEVPELLQSTSAITGISACIIGEYLLIAIILYMLLRKINRLPYLENDDTISLFEILLVISAFANLCSAAYVYLGQFLRTAYTAMTNDINVYIKYDSILGVFEWIFLFSFIAMLYCAYKYGNDVLYRIKTDK